MAISKIILNGITQIDLTQDTVSQTGHILAPYIGHLNDGTQVTGTGTGSGSASITEVENEYGTEVVVVGGEGGNPSSMPQHTIHFEFTDETNEDIICYFNNSFIGNAIMATIPTTYNNKTVTLAQLDNVTWFSYSQEDIPINTELINQSKFTSGYQIIEDGTL